MFTEEEKIRTIELYFKYGKKLALVVREPGYPSKRNLRRWIRSWKAGDGAKESIRHKHRYSDEQKQVAVEHYLNHGCCLAFTSRALGYPCTDVLARWVNELYPGRRRIFTSKTSPVAPFEPEVKRQAVSTPRLLAVLGMRTITQRKERFVQSVSERKITCSSVAITAASVEHCCTG
ncbi:transposase family protein [Escherichia coli 2729250]|uniref:IS3 family transposase n=1 Tax=Escherichia coli TaxID=562 RepID=T2HRW3_ECOLX|nr:transposase family protein [Escherichia coli 2747800]ENA46932.1 transposase family protein [Escherichia coli 2729250]ENE04913.1 transposase family protein [Escherichia coli p0305293.14]ENG25161.1 transposase family protein [Escherichia coli p0305293.10]ENG42106.1 transposase family protein [Escherichia coli p0305293.12]ENG50550.1 transposase family protein [Escherichia coli p0305293.15]KEM88848.1 transposase family protein [Escherichia coli 6-319-05_S1_C1]STI41686.1 transposase IS3 family